MVDNTLPHERRDSYVYVIFRPTGEPCYVGKGRRNRWKDHATRNSYNLRLNGIYRNANGDLPIVKVREGMTNNEACELEIALIAILGRVADDSGPLVNITLGGEGVPGWVPSEQDRAKMSAAGKGRKKSLEHRNAIGAAHVGMKRSDETRAKMRAAAALNAEKKAASVAAYHASMDEEQKAKRAANISAALQEAYLAKPDVRAKLHLRLKKGSSG